MIPRVAALLWMLVMDARSVSKAVGFGTGTINSWINHDLIPGMAPGERGRPHRFHLEALTHLVIMAEMVRLGFSAGFASQIAKQRDDAKRLLLGDGTTLALQMVPHAGGKIIMREGAPMAVSSTKFESEEEDLPKKLATFPGGRPGVYVVVDIEALTARARQVWDEWQQEQASTSAA